MDMHLLEILRSVTALGAGGIIGLAFGTLQNAALRRNEKRAQEGTLKSGWSLMPGSGARVGYLLLALALIQLICPMLFVDGVQWWVSGGVVLGYGSLLCRNLVRVHKASRA